jgi:hypothetical protein
LPVAFVKVRNPPRAALPPEPELFYCERLRRIVQA